MLKAMSLMQARQPASPMPSSPRTCFDPSQTKREMNCS